jgi:NAD(P)-dependent dehydrogenase (short-subunit alcohol dehydrogenase family)
MSGRLEGRVALVTGAASGIGRAIALAFAQEGAAVSIVDLDLARAQTVASRISDGGLAAIALQADVSNAQAVEDAVAQTVARLGNLHILVNNAGIILQAPVLEMREDQWDRILTNNLKSCFLCSQAAARRMIAQGSGGRIINISSIHAQLSEPNAAAYTAAKGGMEAFSRTLATELAPHRITVNCVEPGATYTDLTTPMYTERVKRALYERIPLKEIAQPEWIAAGVVFLATDEARYMTGQVLTIDGGYVMDGSLPGAAYWTE